MVKELGTLKPLERGEILEIFEPWKMWRPWKILKLLVKCNTCAVLSHKGN
jgi:hypothetical protein